MSRLTAMDIEKQEFRTKLRGYDPDDVRLFLQSVAEEIERLNLDNGTLREELGRSRQTIEEFRNREQTLQQTLVTAQSMSGEMKEKAKSEAELLIARARLSAERMLQQAQDQLARLETEIGRCRLERDLFERRLRSTIDEHLTLLDQRQEGAREIDNLHVLPRRAGSDAG
ncbi:MAG TPA: DivIVA domain-containing protein [Candidatus Polarisedimenticolaceae bacterium]|nr:DivIVA domain-containing protein [Candidatus Polarisedimenticolaceae bacterium]